MTSSRPSSPVPVAEPAITTAEPAGPVIPPPAPETEGKRKRGLLRLVGTGMITGAADDDPSAIGTYASGGAKFGLGLLWVAPLLLPMMVVVVYLSAKLGRVYGKGLFAAVRDRYPRWLLYPLVAGATVGNLIEAAANLGGIGAGLGLLIPLPAPALIVPVALALVAVQIIGSYDMLRSWLRWLTLALLAYPIAAILARPDWGAVLRGTLIPHVRMDADFLGIIVACIGTSLSAYVYTWQSNQEVEEQIADGRTRAWQRRGASRRELSATRSDVVAGMIFSNLILYAIILSTGATLHASGQTEVTSAAQAAQALAPLAGEGAKLLFTLGIVGVGLLAVPVMTTGAAYDLVQGIGAKGSLHDRPSEAKLFYGTILFATLVAIGLNLLGFNPMKVLLWSGIVQGFSVPPLLFLMMRITNDPTMMGEHVNSRLTNLFGWITTLSAGAAGIGLIASWLL